MNGTLGNVETKELAPNSPYNHCHCIIDSVTGRQSDMGDITTKIKKKLYNEIEKTFGRYSECDATAEAAIIDLWPYASEVEISMY